MLAALHSVHSLSDSVCLCSNKASRLLAFRQLNTPISHFLHDPLVCSSPCFRNNNSAILVTIQTPSSVNVTSCNYMFHSSLASSGIERHESVRYHFSMPYSLHVCVRIHLPYRGGGARTYRLLPCGHDDLDDICEPVGSVQPQEAIGNSVAAVHVALAQESNLVQELKSVQNIYDSIYIIMDTLGIRTI